MQTAALLNNSKVLISGIKASAGNFAELYDPSTGKFAVAGALNCNYIAPTATLLPNGKVLIAEGQFVLNAGDRCKLDGGGAELYDASAGTFSFTGYEMTPSVAEQTATLLTNGGVLVAGGSDDVDGSYNGAQVYDASTGTFTANGGMTARRDQHTATLLPDATVLIAGGVCAGQFCLPSAGAAVELYDPFVGAFAAAGTMTAGRSSHTATLLPNGEVLMSGGYGDDGLPLASAELYKPPLLKPAPALFSVSGGGTGQGAIWHGDTGQIASSDSPANAGDILALYTTNLIDGGVIPPQVTVGGRLAEILYFGGAPGYGGYNQVNFRLPNGVAPGTAVSVRLTYLGRPSNEVTIAVR